MQDSKFVSFLLSFRKRARAADSAPAVLSLKLGVGQEAETLTEEALKRRVKVIQYEAI